MKERRINQYAKGLKLKGFLAPFFKLIEALLELMIPLIISSIVDRGIMLNDKRHILICFILLISFGVVSYLFALCAQYFASLVAAKYTTRLRKDLYAHIQNLRNHEFEKLGTSTLLVRLTTSCNQVQIGINMFLRLFLRSPFIVLGALVMAFIVDYKMGLIFLGALPIVSLIVFLIMKNTLPRYQENQEKLDELTKEVKENLEGVRVIRAFSSEESEIANFKKTNEEYLNQQNHVSKISSWLNPLSVLVVNLMVVLILYLGGIRVNVGTLSDGQVIALYNYTGYILIELVKFANLVITISKALASNKRINEIFAINSEYLNQPKTPVEKPYLTFENVNFAYSKKGKEVLKDISFELLKNQTLGIIGGTGSGKSTLINLILNSYNLKSGHIYLDNHDVSAFTKEELVKKVALVNQKAVLFKGTIRSNLVSDDQVSEEEILKALEISQSLDIIKSKKDGLDSEVEQEGRNFSGGQKQRLSIARSLLKKPELLILDDSSSALDFQTDLKLRNGLKKLKNVTTIIISQRTSSLMNCDHIIVLDNGRIESQGTHDELLKTSKIYREIHALQYQSKEEK